MPALWSDCRVSTNPGPCLGPSAVPSRLRDNHVSPAPHTLADCTATLLLHLYRTGQASPVEATQSVLARVNELEPTLNAFCVVDADAALASARASETRWTKGAPLDLVDGIPV